VIDFRWGTGAAAVGLPADNFSARWSRQVTFESGIYRLYALADNGIRVYVDAKLVVDEWYDGSGDEVYTADLVLDGKHKVVVEYYERDGSASVKFWWKRTGDWPTPEPNQPPVAVDDTVTIDEDTRVHVDVLANDSDPDGDALTVSDFDGTGARGGTVKCADTGTCTYRPPANFSGRDTFAYTVSDGKGGVAFGTVTIKIRPVNDPPVAEADVAATDEDTRVRINVLANDSDPDGDVLAINGYDAASAQGGKVKCSDVGICAYTPPAGFTGTDSFTYTVDDGNGGSAIGTVTVVVSPVRDSSSQNNLHPSEILPVPDMAN
jgi:hypothetical protein